MRLNPIHAVLIGAAFSLSGAVFAQAGADQPSKTESFTHGESKRCESMTGTAKEECDREEATKAEGAQAESADAPPDPANSPASAGGTGALHPWGIEALPDDDRRGQGAVRQAGGDEVGRLSPTRHR